MSYQLSRRQFLLSSASVAATSATVLPGCKMQSNNNQTDQTHRIALLGDVHFHDIHGDFGFNDNEVVLERCKTQLVLPVCLMKTTLSSKRH
ncbi:hypothetical protein [Photobacterium angustum]|uniref:hypothetical protein n=1 Tax=Photobacterium angustum TaxID=661 RepID=UPI001F33EE6E|nr:hypothetical protein [Photobacterium angustum]